jgi:serine/threonine protein kinase
VVESNSSSGLSPGRRVGNGRYELKRRLGAGGMGEVWLAQDHELHEEVALKFLPGILAADTEALDDLRRETQRSRRLTHPNIIRIHDFCRFDGEPPFISMEYIEGITLSALKAEQPQRLLAWEFLRPLVRQLCDALDYAHGEKVIHRDLKPANMMLDARGRLKLADFGIAATASESVSRVSRDVGSSGTPAYMSPQQMTSQPPRVTDDVYALGATLYELLTSKPPFYAGDIFRQVQETPPTPLDQRLAELEKTNPVPADVGALIMACLAKEPHQRPQSAGAVAEWIGLDTGTASSLSPLTSHVFQPATDEAEPLAALPQELEWRQREPGNAGGRTGPGMRYGLFSLLAVGVVALLIFATQRSASPGSKPETDPGPDTTTGPTAQAATNPALSPAVNLLALADARVDTLSGAWQQVQGGLLAPSGPGVRLAFPYHAPAEYDFEIEFVIQSGYQVSQLLSHDNRTFHWAMGGAQNTMHGLGLVKGSHLPGKVETNQFQAMQPGKTYVSRIEVRRDGVKAYLDGRLLLEHRTDFSDLSAMPHWELSDRQTLGIGSYNTAALFRRAEIREISGAGKVLRQSSAGNAGTLVGSEVSTGRWTNSLGMVFAPVPGTDVRFSIWHTRVQDYEAFVRATEREWKKVGDSQGPVYPVVNVTWEDAQAFCVWLTEQERRSGTLMATQTYRLPQDWEWSMAVGLNEPRTGTPAAKSLVIEGQYPWGTQWPPPHNAGNFAQVLKVDDYERMSPVGSFKANSLGLYDMAGNTWQWCEDWHDPVSKSNRVIRGSSFGIISQGSLSSSYRVARPPTLRGEFFGFRTVLAEPSMAASISITNNVSAATPKKAPAAPIQPTRPAPKSTKPAARIFYKSGSCCYKALQARKQCDHPCCIEATAAGVACSKCRSGY